MKPHYILFDTETGGLKGHHSLLEFYGVTLSKDLEPVAELHLFIKPNDGEDYIVTAGALKVNGIDLVEHEAKAVTRNEASLKLYNFIKEAKEAAGRKIIPVGHNIPFDLKMVHNQLMNEAEWNKWCDYHFIDTCVMAEVLKIAGLLPPKVSKLGTVATKLGVKFDASNLHGAKYDIMVNLEVLKKMISLIKQEK